jgi:F-actin capping protein, beta subunit
VWDKEEYGSFALAFLMKKEVDDLKGIDKGIWDSINVVDVKFDPIAKTANYKVTTSIIMEMVVKTLEAGEIILSGSLSKKVGALLIHISRLY